MIFIFYVGADFPANVAYQEVDLSAEFVRQFHRYIPNVSFSSPDIHTDTLYV